MVLLSEKTLWPQGVHISAMCFYQVMSLTFVMKQGITFAFMSKTVKFDMPCRLFNLYATTLCSVHLISDLPSLGRGISYFLNAVDLNPPLQTRHTL